MKLRAGDVLHEQDRPAAYVYFPMTGICGLVVADQTGERIDVATIGCEGVTSVYAAFAANQETELAVQLQPATVLQIPVADFEAEMDRHATLRSLVREFYRCFTGDLMQSVACNRLHSARQRYCRRLLALSDRLGSETLKLTHTEMATMLGSTRPSVTMIALELKETGSISYRRNSVTIVDRQQLESFACECYHSLRSRIAPLLPPPS
jgi:CRP-like cAMP-binding protein